MTDPRQCHQTDLRCRCRVLAVSVPFTVPLPLPLPNRLPPPSSSPNRCPSTVAVAVYRSRFRHRRRLPSPSTVTVHRLLSVSLRTSDFDSVPEVERLLLLPNRPPLPSPTLPFLLCPSAHLILTLCLRSSVLGQFFRTGFLSLLVPPSRWFGRRSFCNDCFSVTRVLVWAGPFSFRRLVL